MVFDCNEVQCTFTAGHISTGDFTMVIENNSWMKAANLVSQCSQHSCMKGNETAKNKVPGKAASAKWMIGFGMFLPLIVISDIV